MLSFCKRNYLWLVLLFILAAVGIGIFFYVNKDTDITKEEKQAQSEAKILYDKVAEHFVLPKDELPTIATVTDPEKLRGQTFFAKAKKGDKVLIFTNAKEAILYDPDIDKVVAVAPLNIDTTPTSSGTNLENNNNVIINNEF